MSLSFNHLIDLASIFKENTNQAPFLNQDNRIFEQKELNLFFSSGFYFISSVDTVFDEDKGSSVPVHVVTVGVVGGVVAVTIVCVAVIIVLRKRHHNVTLTKSRGIHEFATPGL